MARKKRDYKLLIDAKFWKDWESLRVHKRILKLRNKAAELSIKFKENEENDDYNNKNVLDAMALYTILQSMYDTLIKK